jgi:hypothetical protein
VTSITTPSGCVHEYTWNRNATNITAGFGVTFTTDNLTASATYIYPNTAGASYHIGTASGSYTSGHLPVANNTTGSPLVDSGIVAVKVVANCGTIAPTASATTTALAVTGYTATGIATLTPTSATAATLMLAKYYVTKASGTITFNWTGVPAGTETFDVGCSLQ